MKIEVLATGDHGDGFTQSIGVFDSIEDIEIRMELFDKDVVITFVEVKEEREVE